jgi:hypothetical protein
MLSTDAEARRRPSGEKATLRTQRVCPSSVRSGAPLAASHSRMVLSKDPEASSRPSGEKAALHSTAHHVGMKRTSAKVSAS